MTALVDTHCHLGMLTAPLDEVLASCEQAGVGRVIDVGMGTAQAAESAQRAVRHTGRVFAAVGIHPNDVGEFVADPEATMDALRDLASREGVVAVGETGLDTYRDRADPADQESAFRAHIALAKDTRRTLVVHCRSAPTGTGDSHERVLRILDAQGPPDRVVMHCFSGDATYARACVDRGFYCSFAGNVTYRTADALREAALAVPVELLLVETDAPYLAPVPHRGQENVPAYVALTAVALADLRGEPHGVLARTLGLNATRAFDLPPLA